VDALQDGDNGPKVHPVNQLILDLAESGRAANDQDIAWIREHVARAGFDSDSVARASPRLAGLEWNGVLLHSRDWLDNAGAHYLRHVVARQEWPVGTTLDEYIASLRNAVLDTDGGILLQSIQHLWHLTFVARSHEYTGPAGGRWIAVGYGVNYGYWVTGYQPEAGLHRFTLALEKGERWLCPLATNNEQTSS